jgi:hypothetical protein
VQFRGTLKRFVDCSVQDDLDLTSGISTRPRKAFHKRCSTIERNTTTIIAPIKSVTCPVALNDVSHEADSSSGFGGLGLGGSGFGGGWFFMLGYDSLGAPSGQLRMFT